MLRESAGEEMLRLHLLALNQCARLFNEGVTLKQDNTEWFNWYYPHLFMLVLIPEMIRTTGWKRRINTAHSGSDAQC